MKLRRLLFRNVFFVPVFAVMLGLGVSLGILGLAEAWLRLCHVPPAPVTVCTEGKRWWDDFCLPLFKKEARNGIAWMVPERLADCKNPPRSFTSRKSPDVLRVFIVGGSVPQGMGAAEPLVRALAQYRPDKKIELINVAFGGYDSFRELSVVREIFRYAPDFIMILSGNNEYYKNRSFLPRLSVILRSLQGWRIFQSLFVWMQRHGPGPRTQMEQLIDFDANLRTMIRLARRRHVPVMIATLPANLRDVLPAPTTFARSRLYLRALVRIEIGDYELASKDLIAHLRNVPGDSDAYFYLGRAMDGLKRFRSAAVFYGYSRDLDFGDKTPHTCELSNAIVRSIACDTHTACADLDRETSAQARDRIPGDEQFYDSCHLHATAYALLYAGVLRCLDQDRLLLGGVIPSGVAAQEFPLPPAPHRFFRDDGGWMPVMSACLFDPVRKYLALADSANKGETYSNAVFLQRYFPEVLQALVSDHDRLNRYFTPYEIATLALENPNWCRIRLNYARGYRQVRQYAQALQILDSTVFSEDIQGIAALEKAWCLEMLGRSAEAEKEFEFASRWHVLNARVLRWALRSAMQTAR